MQILRSLLPCGSPWYHQQSSYYRFCWTNFNLLKKLIFITYCDVCYHSFISTAQPWFYVQLFIVIKDFFVFNLRDIQRHWLLRVTTKLVPVGNKVYSVGDLVPAEPVRHAHCRRCCLSSVEAGDTRRVWRCHGSATEGTTTAWWDGRPATDRARSPHTTVDLFLQLTLRHSSPGL